MANSFFPLNPGLSAAPLSRYVGCDRDGPRAVMAARVETSGVAYCGREVENAGACWMARTSKVGSTP
jgi:hypothetical protein